MTVADLEMVLGWAAKEGWNPGMGDATAFQVADPEGFLLAEVAGEPVAAISVVNHSESFAFLGLYLCRPEWRGQGLGMTLWRAGLVHAGARTVGLDGVAAQEANYARSGFKRTGATIRFEGRTDAAEPSGLRDARSADLPQILDLDRLATGVDRARFLSAWVAPAPDRQTVVLERDGRLLAFATMRLCHIGCRIGPIIASDCKHALDLISAAGLNGPSIIDVPEANAELAAALITRGYRETFRTARMYRGPAPRENGQQQAIATMELG